MIYSIIQVRMYSHLFTVEEPSEAWELELNPESLIIHKGARVDPSLINWDPKVESSFQVRFFITISFFMQISI